MYRRKRVSTISLFCPLSENLFSTPVEGKITTVIEPNQAWRVSCQGTSWPAKPYQTGSQLSLTPGQVVTLIGRRGNTLLIQPKSNRPFHQ